MQYQDIPYGPGEIVVPADLHDDTYCRFSLVPADVWGLFAHLKRILRLGRLRLQGTCRDICFTNELPGNACAANGSLRVYAVPAHSILFTTAQNLRKLAKIFPAPQQTRKA